LYFVVWLVIPDGRDQVVPFPIVGRALGLRESPDKILRIRLLLSLSPARDVLAAVDARPSRRMRVCGDHGRAFRSMDEAGEFVVHAGHVTAVEKKACAGG